MAREIINVGSVPNDGLGDPLRTAFTKTNNNFAELYSRQTDPPTSSIGSPGDFAGMWAFDDQFFYWCTGSFDNTTLIWLRVSGSFFF